MSSNRASVDEFGLIADLFAPLAAGYPGALGLIDDAALIAEEPGTDLVATVDAMVAGIHFLPDDPPDLVARKLMRVNLSDLAAKGARPVAVLLAAAFPHDVTMDWLQAFAAGLGQDLAAFGMGLAGGDTVMTPGPLTLSLTALGRVPAGCALLRSNARVDDDVWVSGTIGDGALGLLAAQGKLDVDDQSVSWLAGRYRLPEPRTVLGPRLIGIAHAAMDVSDGLVQDLGHLARASGCSAVIEQSAVPLSQAANLAIAGTPSLLASVLTGGDDYEILFTAPADRRAALAHLSAGLALRLTRIGRMAAGNGVSVVDSAGRPVDTGQGGWRHFRGRTEF